MEKNKITYKSTKEQWISYLDQHNVELLNYVKTGQASKAKISFLCRTCQTEGTAEVGNIVRRKNHPCPKCSNYEFYTTENIKEIIESHGGIYLGGEVKGKTSVVQMNCACGAYCEKTAHDIKRRPDTCKNCKAQKSRATVLSRNRNLDKARLVAQQRGGQCLTDNQLVTTEEPLEWCCSLGHKWPASLYSVISLGTWCPECKNSIAEKMVRAIMEATYQRSFPQTRPDFLSDLQMHLDGFNEELHLAFEHHGRQHYELNKKFHKSQQDLQEQNELPRSKLRGIKEHQLISVQLLILRFAALISDIVGNCLLIALLPYGIYKIAFCPKLATP